MIDYASYEDDICTLLTNSSYDCKPLPDNEAEFNRNFTKPQVYVSYSGSDFSEPENIGATIQEETVNFDILFRARTRRGDTGLLKILKLVGDKILGYKFEGCSKITLTKQGYIDRSQNDWNFILSVRFLTHIVENLDEEEVPNITEINFDE